MFAFRPAIIPALRDYRRSDFFADLGGGLTVEVIALLLAGELFITDGDRSHSAGRDQNSV